MTDSPHIESKIFHFQPSLGKDQSSVQISQDIWKPLPSGDSTGRPALTGVDAINSVAEETFHSLDKTIGFQRLNGHEGPGLLTIATLRDNLLSTVKDQLTPDARAKYENEGYKPWLLGDKREPDMKMHEAVKARERKMEEEVVKKAFGDLSLTDQYQIMKNGISDDSVASANAQRHLREAITQEAHHEIDKLTQNDNKGGIFRAVPGIFDLQKVELL